MILAFVRTLLAIYEERYLVPDRTREVAVAETPVEPKLEKAASPD